MRELWPKLLGIGLLTILSIVLIWLPFYTRLTEFWTVPLGNQGMGAVVSNFDGPYYLVVTRSWYEGDLIKQFEFDEPVEYYAAHFPLYPATIGLLERTGIPLAYAMLASTVISAILAQLMFVLLAKEAGVKNPIWLGVVFLVLPARWVVVKAIGSPEPQFMFLTMWSIYSFMKGRYWQAGLAGALAQLTKPPGILLFGAMGITLLVGWVRQNVKHKESNWLKTIPWAAWPISLIPAALIGLWVWYGKIYGSFWAYFESGDNIHLFWPPFQMFNREAYWVGEFWLEDIVWLLLITLGAVVILWKRRDLISFYTLIFFLSISFVSHRDVARYALPMMPLVLIAYAPWLEKKEFRLVLAVMAIPVYLYTLNYIAGNTTPISDWRMLL